MNNYIFNRFPKDYTKRIIINNKTFNFLDFLNDGDYNNYYNLLQSIEEFKLKNIYQYLFLRSIKINKGFSDFKILIKNEKFINTEQFNNLLNEYIDNDNVRAITIINGIDNYFYH